jgi:hypothetical protein
MNGDAIVVLKGGGAALGARELCFDVTTHFYTVDMPAGWEWGSAELDPQNYVIVRTNDPEILGAINDLRARRKKLGEALDHSGEDNIFLGAALAECSEREWINTDIWTVLRSGEKYYSEEDLFGSVQDGDDVVLAKAGAGEDRLFFAIHIASVADGVAGIRQSPSFEAAANFLDQKGFENLPPAPPNNTGSPPLPPEPPPVEPPAEPEPTLDPAYLEDPPVPVPEPPPYEPPADGIWGA